jgi:hypothetical protein
MQQQQQQYSPRALVVDELMREYEENSNAMYANVERIARKHKLLGEHDMMMSDDLREELVLEALGEL